MKKRIVLDTKTQLDTFVSICERFDKPVYLTDGTNEFRVSAKSTLGCILARTEWASIYCEYSGEASEEMRLERELRSHHLTAE